MKIAPKTYRKAVQWGFLLFVLYLGFWFSQFAWYYDMRGAVPFVPHPDGVEGFLPIGALTSLKYWLVTGTIHPAHPAAMFIFIGAIATSIVFKKSFCGWICPVGLLEELLHKPWMWVFKKDLKLAVWIDYPLRSLKYILFILFFWAIVIGMGIHDLHVFLDGDYWKVADVKMLRFFTDISALALDIIVLLVILSVLFRGFWCRYLCPYGAFLGLASLLSPFGIKRDKDKCTSCGKCARECPAYLPVDKKERVLSVECTSCQTCVSICPEDALSYSTTKKNYTLSGPKLASGVLGVFLAVYLIALATGHWHSQIPEADLKRLVPVAESLEHP